MTLRLSGHFSIFGLAFFMLNSLLGIARRWNREIFAILSLKHLSHIKILIYRTWVIYCRSYRDSTMERSRLKMFTHWLRDVSHGILPWSHHFRFPTHWTMSFSTMDLFKIKTVFFFDVTNVFVLICSFVLFCFCFFVFVVVLFCFFAVVCIWCNDDMCDDCFVKVIINNY